MLDEDLKYLRDRVDHIIERLNEQNTILAKNTSSLEYHILRTDTN